MKRNRHESKRCADSIQVAKEYEGSPNKRRNIDIESNKSKKTNEKSLELTEVIFESQISS